MPVGARLLCAAALAALPFSSALAQTAGAGDPFLARHQAGLAANGGPAHFSK
jgi:hypothetical protein